MDVSIELLAEAHAVKARTFVEENRYGDAEREIEIAESESLGISPFPGFLAGRSTHRVTGLAKPGRSLREPLRSNSS